MAIAVIIRPSGSGYIWTYPSARKRRSKNYLWYFQDSQLDGDRAFLLSRKTKATTIWTANKREKEICQKELTRGQRVGKHGWQLEWVIVFCLVV